MLLPMRGMAHRQQTTANMFLRRRQMPPRCTLRSERRRKLGRLLRVAGDIVLGRSVGRSEDREGSIGDLGIAADARPEVKGVVRDGRAGCVERKIDTDRRRSTTRKIESTQCTHRESSDFLLIHAESPRGHPRSILAVEVERRSRRNGGTGGTRQRQFPREASRASGAR